MKPDEATVAQKETGWLEKKQSDGKPQPASLPTNQLNGTNRRDIDMADEDMEYQNMNKPDSHNTPTKPIDIKRRK